MECSRKYLDLYQAAKTGDVKWFETIYSAKKYPALEEEICDDDDDVEKTSGWSVATVAGCFGHLTLIDWVLGQMCGDQKARELVAADAFSFALFAGQMQVLISLTATFREGLSIFEKDESVIIDACKNGRCDSLRWLILESGVFKEEKFGQYAKFASTQELTDFLGKVRLLENSEIPRELWASIVDELQIPVNRKRCL